MKVHMSIDVRVGQKVLVAEDAAKHGSSIWQTGRLANSLTIYRLIHHIQPETLHI